MKFTRCATLGLSLIGLLSGCSDDETIISVNVRYWTDYLDAASFKVTIAQEGKTTVEESLVPRDLGDGKFDVVCDHDWELPYCRFYKRFDVSGWSESDVTVTFSGETLDGVAIEEDVEARNITDQLSNTFELQENEVNVVYFQLANVKAPSDPVSPGTDSSDSSSSAPLDGGVGDAGDGGTTDAGTIGTDASVTDASVVEPGDAAATDAGASASPDGATSGDAGNDSGVTAPSVDAAPDAADAN